MRLLAPNTTHTSFSFVINRQQRLTRAPLSSVEGSEGEGGGKDLQSDLSPDFHACLVDREPITRGTIQFRAQALKRQRARLKLGVLKNHLPKGTEEGTLGGGGKKGESVIADW